MNLHADSDVIIAAYLLEKKSGDQLTLGGLMEYGIRRKEAQAIILYLEEKGMIERRTGGSIFYVDRDAIHDQHTENEWQIRIYRPLELTPSTAYELFDPNPNIFRGVVVEEEGIFPETKKRRRPEIKILLPDGTEKRCIVSTYGNDGFASDGIYRNTINALGRKMKKGELVLVRQKGIVPGRDGFLSVEPLFFIEEKDNAIFNGRRMTTRTDDSRIFDLPIVEEGLREPEKRRGIGYIQGTEDKLTPVYVNGAKDRIWHILPEIRILQTDVVENFGRHYVCEVP